MTTVDMALSPNGRELPDGWRWARLGDVCDFLDSRRIPVNTAERMKRIQGKRESQLFPYYGANGQTGWIDDFLFDEPLILLAEDGGNFGSSDRPIAYAVDGKYWVNNHAHVLRPHPDVDFRYCLHALRIRPDVGELISGSTRGKLNQQVAAGIMLPLPPLPEQRRIAAILTEQLAAVERARAAAESQLEAAKALPAAYLRAVFESDEARDWPVRRLGELAEIVQNGIYKPADYYGHGVPFLRMYNIRNEAWSLDLSRLALVAVDDRGKQNFAVHYGDILVSRVNSFELVGKCARVDAQADGYLFENMLIRLTFGPSIDSLFIAQQMAARQVREQIQAVAKRAIGQASINSADVRGIQLSMPPLHLQRQVSAKLERLTTQAGAVQLAVAGQADAFDALSSALLRRAFRGAL